MIGNKRITIVADSIIDDVKVASFGAILNVDDLDLSLTARYIDKDVCKMNRDIVRADQAEFEDYAYSLQDQLKG